MRQCRKVAARGRSPPVPRERNEPWAIHQNLLSPGREGNRRTSNEAEATKTSAVEQAKRLMADLAVKALREGSRENGNGG